MLIKRNGITRECSEKTFLEKYKPLGFEVVETNQEIENTTTQKQVVEKATTKTRGIKPTGKGK